MKKSKLLLTDTEVLFMQNSVLNVLNGLLEDSIKDNFFNRKTQIKNLIKKIEKL